MNTTLLPANCIDTGVAIDAPAAKTVSAFLKPAIVSWISAPYETVSIEFKPVPCQVRAAESVKLAAAVDSAAVVASEAVTLATFDASVLSKLAPELQEMAAESNIAHVQKIIQFLQKGGESIQAFGKVFLNDLAMQKEVLSSLVSGTSSAALNQLDNLQKEFALRLAACVQAREVAQLMLAGC